LALFLILLPTASLAGGESLIILTPSGIEVEFIASAFAPGQVIMARLAAVPRVRKVIIRLGDQDHDIGPKDAGLESFALIGLDLAVKPGLQKVRITTVGRDGQVEVLEKDIRLAARIFPEKKLWVKEEYVTPPLEVRERIAREAEILDLVYGRTTERWLGSGSFVLPHDGEMAANFGEKRTYNNVPRSTHSGVDISAPSGSPVRAANSGRVVLARDLYFSGKTVIIDHGLGLFTFYCHFSRLRVKRGDLVKKGDVIALAGSTGRSTGPHLHWGARISKSRVDPVGLISLPLPE
jgi:murein DD-endopeptidase MepM/ murein hydrolase activator NlpD